MCENRFHLKNHEEVVKFEQESKRYVSQTTVAPLAFISLGKAYSSLQSREDGGRVFSALLDIHICLIFLYCDLSGIGGTWNQYFSKGKLEGGSILDNPAKFNGKMNILRFSISYVLRYRALWDKIMGFLVLYYAKEKYVSFFKAKSRKKIFRNIASEINEISEDFVLHLEDAITKFDSTFRTSEAHGVGALRKWSLSMESLDKNPQIELMWFWNFMTDTAHLLNKIFDPEKYQNKDIPHSKVNNNEQQDI